MAFVSWTDFFLPFPPSARRCVGGPYRHCWFPGNGNEVPASGKPLTGSERMAYERSQATVNGQLAGIFEQCPKHVQASMAKKAFVKAVRQ